VPSFLEDDPMTVVSEPPPAPRPDRRRRKAAPRPARLASRLAREVLGQDEALAIVARAVTNHLAKPFPSRPETIALLGPTGTGKTSTVGALPGALAGLGVRDRHVFRVDCNELVHASDVRRVLGAPPSYIGYVEETPLVAALRRPGCIVLLDEVEKATQAVFDVFLGLLDDGRLTAPDGETIEAPGAIVVLTTNEGADDLVHRLDDVPAGGRAEQEACREHLLRAWWPPELVGRIGTFAVYEPLDAAARRGVAERAIHRLAAEFGVAVGELEPVLADVVSDLADASDIGARALTYAARDLLADAFADAARAGVQGDVRLEAGPPPRVVGVT
jgi:ATP-dependent Clp protease ATP-binding subunit ClpA